MSEKKDCVKEGCSVLKSPDFKNALEQFQKLVEKMIIQKTKEGSGLCAEEDDEIDYDKFYKTTRALFGSAVKDHNIQAFFRKTINNLDMPDWLEMKVQATINVEDTAWITGCDFLPQLKYVVAVTESTVVIWDYKSEEKDNGYVIKPMKNCLLCVCTVTTSDHVAKDSILMGDDKGYVYLLTLTSDDFIMKQYKAEKESQFRVLDSENLNILKRKLHDDWVGKVRYISALKRFGSCSSDSLRSFVLDDIKRLEDNLPAREFSVPKGVNAFTYCGKAKVVVTGGNDRVLRLWNPAINIRPTGKLLGHKHSVVEIVTNEKDQHVISLSSAKVFRVWDVQTFAPLQVFHDNQGSPAELDTFPMVFDNDHGILITGSDVIDIYPLANVIEDTRHLPQTHEKSINALIYNRALHQILTICTESILKVWDLETGYQIYQIEDAHGVNTEVTCAAIEINGFYVATGACDGTVKIWEFESGQEFKALPLAQHSEDEHRVLKIVYLKADESQHSLLVLEKTGKMKLIQSFVPSVEINCFAVLKAEGWSLIATGSANGEITLWDFEYGSVRCLRETNKDSQDSVFQECGVNAMLFLVHSAFTSRKRSSQPSTAVTGDVSATPEHESSSLNPNKENVENDKVNTEITTAEDTATSENTQYPKMNVQSSKPRVGHSPILASAHGSGCIRLWSIQQVKEKLCWRAHNTEVVDLFHEKEKNVVVTASTDGSVRIWHAENGYYFGYFGQSRKFELSDTSRLILPSDVNNFTAIIREESKPMEKKVEYPLMLDKDKWKSLTRLPLVLEKAQHANVIQDFKFFQALAPEKMEPLEIFEAGSKEAGAVYGILPIYEVYGQNPDPLLN
ncbi:WD repeat domain 64 [Pitangus sulphuratus]|nr:WD repeat domain 64 [Pitangus sulphuratus]